MLSGDAQSDTETDATLRFSARLFPIVADLWSSIHASSTSVFGSRRKIMPNCAFGVQQRKFLGLDQGGIIG
jgi:hypothetical protein